MYQFTQTVAPYNQVFNRTNKNFNQNNLQANMLLPMIYNLQQNVLKQQMALQLCFTQRRQYNNIPVRSHPVLGTRQLDMMQIRKQAFLFNSQGSDESRLVRKEKSFIKETSIKVESNVEVSTTPSTGNILDQYTIDHNPEQNSEGNTDINAESDERKEPQIIRRNGFKDQSNEETSEGKGPRKSNKLITPKRPPSNAKHLWINYGRKIIEFALQQTENETQILIKRLVGKLSSKNDFKKVFEINQTDSEEEKAFKNILGKLALFFIRFKAASAFEDSKYKPQMIAQRDFVASWIVQLTGL